MREQIITTGTSADQRRGERPAHRFADGLRVGLIMVTVVAALYVARGYGKLFSEWRQTGRPVVANDSTAADSNSMAAVLPLAGRWSFADLDWNLKSQAIEVKEIDACLAALANSPALSNIEQLPDVSEELLELTQMLRIQPVERAGNQVYRVDRSDLKAQLIVRTTGEATKAIALAAAYPRSGDQWQFVELTPRQSTASAGARAAHLLPLTGGAKRNGGRFDDDGDLLLELISLDSNADSLVTIWIDAGWEVRPTGLGGPDDFSYLCGRGSEVIYAWSANPRNSIQNLILVRTPNDTETKP